MNTLTGTWAEDEVWEGAGEHAEDDGQRDPDSDEYARMVLEKTLAHFDIRAMIALKERRASSMHYYVQTDIDDGAERIRDLKGELELSLARKPISFTDVPDKSSAITVIVPRG
jgi:hypothetical protein